jgi:hypothetical protein
MKRDGHDDLDPNELDRIPRRSFWSAMPKHSFTRIFMLLAALVGILYLRQKTSTVAGCMGEAFKAPYQPRVPSTIRAEVTIPSGDASQP